MCHTRKDFILGPCGFCGQRSAQMFYQPVCWVHISGTEHEYISLKMRDVHIHGLLPQNIRDGCCITGEQNFNTGPADDMKGPTITTPQGMNFNQMVANEGPQRHPAWDLNKPCIRCDTNHGESNWAHFMLLIYLGATPPAFNNPESLIYPDPAPSQHYPKDVADFMRNSDLEAAMAASAAARNTAQSSTQVNTVHGIQYDDDLAYRFVPEGYEGEWQHQFQQGGVEEYQDYDTGLTRINSDGSFGFDPQQFPDYYDPVYLPDFDPSRYHD